MSAGRVRRMTERFGEVADARFLLKANTAPKYRQGSLLDELRDETTGEEGVGTLTSASARRGRRKEVEDMVEEFEGEFVEQWNVGKTPVSTAQAL
jgi:hypothetical protein